MVKLVYTPDLGSGAARRGGSSPLIRTTYIKYNQKLLTINKNDIINNTVIGTLAYSFGDIMTKSFIINYLKEHKQEFKTNYNVEKIGLFGSYSRDEATENSDIDIFVTMQANLLNMVAVKEKIEDDLHKKVDLIREHKNMKSIFLEMIQKDVMYA